MIAAVKFCSHTDMYTVPSQWVYSDVTGRDWVFQVAHCNRFSVIIAHKYLLEEKQKGGLSFVICTNRPDLY